MRTTPSGVAGWLVVAVAAAIAAGACRDPGGRGTGDGARQRSGADPSDTSDSAGASDLPDERLAIPLPDVRVSLLDGGASPVLGDPPETTVVNFWATWCVPCLEEIPELVALEDSIGPRGGRVLGIAMSSGSAEDIRKFAEKHAMDYDLGTATFEWVRRHFTVFGLPVTLVVDRGGIIRRRLVGPHRLAQFLSAVAPYLPPSDSAGERPTAEIRPSRR